MRPNSSSSRYHPLSRHYQRRFGCKVYKVSVSVAQSCPNREGMRGMSVCIFCDAHGSAAYPEQAHLPLAEQIRVNSQRIRKRYGAEKFLVYFQAYTSTFARVSAFDNWLQEALRAEDVVGVVIGTRPDCLTPGVLKRLNEVARKSYVSVELGVQTLNDGQLNWLKRGHDAASALLALKRLGDYPALESCVHLMFGLPGETDAQLAHTAHALSSLGVHGVKLHNLHVLANTPLEKLYKTGVFKPVSLDEYARKVAVFLEHLHPDVVVHRLNAVANRWDEVVAPDWVREKLRPTQHILQHMAQRQTWQGKRHEGITGETAGETRIPSAAAGDYPPIRAL